MHGEKEFEFSFDHIGLGLWCLMWLQYFSYIMAIIGIFTTDNTPYQEKAILETLLVINSLLSVYCLENLCSIKFIVSRIKIILTFSNWVQLKMFQWCGHFRFQNNTKNTLFYCFK